MTEQEIFTEALNFSTASERNRFLDESCGAGTALRNRLDDLLSKHEVYNPILDRNPKEITGLLSSLPSEMEASPEETRAAILRALAPYLNPSVVPGSLGQLGHYELQQVLGQGGYGLVFKAHDTKLNRPVAIKVLAPQLAVTSAPRRRFLREARSAAAVRHENVVQTYAVEELPIPYLVMEFISGETLQERSDRLGPFSASDVVHYGVQIARGLAAAHETGLIHRDVKPRNILIEDGVEPRAKLTDFGLARAADDASVSQSGVVIGTPMYMSPEQANGLELDQRADLFSLGSVMYLMATGRPPFRAPTTIAVMKRVAEDTPRSIHDINPDIPDPLCDVIAQLQSKSREDRFSSASVVGDVLSTCLTAPVSRQRRRLSDKVTQSFWKHPSTILLSIVLVGLIAANLSGLIGNLATSNREAQTALKNSADADSTGNPQNKIADASSSPVEIADASHPVLPADPTTWRDSVAAMGVTDQIAAVRNRMRQLNPKLNAEALIFEVTDGVVTVVKHQQTENLVDLSPFVALRGLKEISIRANTGAEIDLSPLKDLALTKLDMLGHSVRNLEALSGTPLEWLGLWGWRGEDLSALKGMKLKGGNFGWSRVKDLEPLRGMQLEYLCMNFSEIEDLTPLAGMPLWGLEIESTSVKDLTPVAAVSLQFLKTKGSQVKDFSPVKELKLKELTLDYDHERDADWLRAMTTLEKINHIPADEFLRINH